MQAFTTTVELWRRVVSWNVVLTSFWTSALWGYKLSLLMPFKSIIEYHSSLIFSIYWLCIHVYIYLYWSNREIIKWIMFWPIMNTVCNERMRFIGKRKQNMCNTVVVNRVRINPVWKVPCVQGVFDVEYQYHVGARGQHSYLSCSHMCSIISTEYCRNYTSICCKIRFHKLPSVPMEAAVWNISMLSTNQTVSSVSRRTSWRCLSIDHSVC